MVAFSREMPNIMNDPQATFTESCHTAWTLSFLNLHPKMSS